jgi:GntR family transcriptional repressor for pyruvate dehydrogenase complex
LRRSAGSPSLHPGPKDDLTAKLLERFKVLIHEGVLTPGCRLPPERELAGMFGVSRSSLRQALKVLEIMGVLSQYVGNGTYLSDGAPTLLAQPLEFLFVMDGISYPELFEARMVVEPEIAARAAQRAASEDLTRLRHTLDVLAGRGLSLERMIEADLEFHDAIFQAAGNRMFRLLFATVHRALLNSMLHTAERGSVRDTLRFHRAIYSAIEARDSSRARQAMADHIKEAADLLRGSAEKHARPDFTRLLKPLSRASRSGTRGGRASSRG